MSTAIKSEHVCRFCEEGKDDDGHPCNICDGTGFDTESTDTPVCPHCGSENELEAEDAPQDDGEPIDWKCRACRQTFEITASWTVSYSTIKK